MSRVMIDKIKEVKRRSMVDMGWCSSAAGQEAAGGNSYSTQFTPTDNSTAAVALYSGRWLLVVVGGVRVMEDAPAALGLTS